MKTQEINFMRNGVACHGTADVFSQEDLPELDKFYFSYKDMNEVNAKYGMRRINFPELISEGLASAIFSWPRTNATSIIGLESNSGDCVDLKTGNVIQIKACSTTADKRPGPTSFGPETKFDELIFIHVNCDTDEAKFYRLDANSYKQLKVNKTETIADQQAQGRRPRLTLLNKVDEMSLQPFYTYTFKRSKG